MDDQTTRPARKRAWFGRGRTRALLSVGLILGMGAVATSAYWKEQTQVTGVTLTAGALHIDLDGRVRVKPENAVAWSGLNLADIAPSATRAAILTVKNNSIGAVKMTYQISGSATNPAVLGGQLSVQIRRGGTVSGTTCINGTLIVTSSVNSLSVGASPVLAAGATDSLCIQVTRSSTVLAGGSTSVVTFTFPATQVP